MFQNEYEPDNAMQKIWESTQGGYCLCTIRESCSNCANPSERRKQGNLIIEIARNMGYQLYTKAWMKNEYFKVNMEGY
ncbi:hypothetical protein QGX17_gp041 [Pseudomonas phage phiPsa381]|uniref:Uncharacterized protein n=1 Tax=Pseudomonas phage phiPsa381 TaxID=1460366 RepID=A0A7G9V312_9CAUD|nr:hypothetical protein QGX17_gp041 [Pseudomonas phage phiPsa381]QNO00668.1 hypothetical protein phiPsa381_041 [Pseudomonas phage phiPsa381]